jgi:hypothetical protein
MATFEERHRQAFEEDLIAAYADERVFLDCECGRGSKRSMQCTVCCQYAPRCSSCFIESHVYLITHPAEVWNYQSQFFESYTITAIPGSPYVIPLGHDGGPCPAAKDKDFFLVSLVDLNGIHRVKISYCACAKGGVGGSWRATKARQLLRAGFFPSSWSDPEIAFSTRVLKHFHYYPQIAYQFMDGLRRATNGAFPVEASVSVELPFPFVWL